LLGGGGREELNTCQRRREKWGACLNWRSIVDGWVDSIESARSVGDILFMSGL